MVTSSHIKIVQASTSNGATVQFIVLRRHSLKFTEEAVLTTNALARQLK